MNTPAPAQPTFAALPRAARGYIATVVAAGACCLVFALTHMRLEHVGLFLLLLVLGMVTSTAKIELPLGRSQSNLSLSHAVNFWALFALGPMPTICIATASAWAQCTRGARGEEPAAPRGVQRRLADGDGCRRQPAAWRRAAARTRASPDWCARRPSWRRCISW